MSTTDFNALDTFQEGVFTVVMIPKDEFAQYIRANRSKARLVVIGGNYRWLINEDGKEHCVQPLV